MTTVEQILDQRRLPTRHEIAALLTKYFVGTVTEEIVTKLREEVAHVLADPPLHAGMARGFDPTNGGRGFGCAWREELAFDHSEPSALELAAWIAWSQPGYLPARPYCPDAFVGTWTQTQPEPHSPRWTLERDGAFSAPGTLFADRVGWCVHRTGSKPDDVSLWLSDKLNIAVKRLVVWNLTAKELQLKPTTGPMIILERA